MSKPIAVVDPFPRTMDEIFSESDLARLHDIASIVWARDDAMPENEFALALQEAEVVITGRWGRNEALTDASQLRAIIDVTGAFPLDLDYEQCAARSIRVLSVAPAFGRQVAEMGLGLALAAARGITVGDRRFREGTEEYLHAGNTDTFMLYGQPVGMIGYGGLAMALQPLLTPFGVRIRAYDPWLGDGYLRHCGVEPAGLEEVLETSRVIFVMAAPSRENVAMLSRERLSKIQPGAVLVLLSRAHVVDFDAMTDLAAAGRFKVATDVFPTEPLAADHPIRDVDDAVLSAHLAGSVREGLWEIGEMVCDDLEAIVRGLPPLRLQNAEPELARRYASNRPPPLDDPDH